MIQANRSSSANGLPKERAGCHYPCTRGSDMTGADVSPGEEQVPDVAAVEAAYWDGVQGDLGPFAWRVGALNPSWRMDVYRPSAVGDRIRENRPVLQIRLP